MRRARHCHGVHGASPLPSLVGWRRSAERRQLPTLRWVLAGILPFSPRAWPQGQCAWASRQSAPPEPMLADVACGSDFYFAAAIRARLSIVARVALLRVASLSSQFDSPACRSLTWAAKVALVEYCSIAISMKRILYGPGNLPGPFCLPGRQLRLLKDASKPVAQPCGRFFAIMGQFSGEKI